MKKLLVVALWLCGFANGLFAQKALTPNQAAGWVSGPMLGYIEHREALIWLEIRPFVKTVQVKYWLKGKPETAKTATLTPAAPSYGYVPIKIKLDNLEMGMTYDYEITLNNKKLTYDFPLQFKTRELWEWRRDAPDFSFLFGSCVYINDSTYDRPGRPYGRSPKIMETMANMPTDFMIWGGDNLYLREADYSSPSGVAYRYSHNFRTPEMLRLRATRANYATWDDHDYGPNDSDSKYELKDFTYQTFQNYWGNKTFGEPDNPGVYTKFKWSDAEFFLLDDRYHRSANKLRDSINGKPNPNKVMFGRKQMDWLKQSLVASKESHQTTFRFIVSGSQMLNTLNKFESFTEFPAEWMELMDFIVSNEIEGIVFLTGDRHFSEILKLSPNGAKYPFYEFTCSSITSGTWDVSKSKEANNPLRVPNMIVNNINNFGKISIVGGKGDRKAILEAYDIEGKRLLNFTIHQKDLKIKK